MPAAAADPPITLRAWGVSHDDDPIRGKFVKVFQQKFPHVYLVHPGGLAFGGNEYNVMFETLPLMKIAGDAAPHVLHLWLGHATRYVQQRFLHPLDKQLERSLDLNIEDGHLMELEPYLQRLKQSEKYEHEIEPRAPDAAWPMMRQPCPEGIDCAYCKRHDMTPAAQHHHVWALPIQISVRVMTYRRDLFKKAGLPDRSPETLEELLEFARVLTDPDESAFGFRVDRQRLARSADWFLGSLGGQIARIDEAGKLQCTFDSEAAVDACYFLCRLFYEPYTNPKGVRLTSVVFPGASSGSVQAPPWRGGIAEIGMFVDSFDEKFFWSWRAPSQFGYGPLPAGPTGARGGKLGGRLFGVYAGFENDQRIVEAGWEWIRFYDGPEGRKIFADSFVEQGKGAFLQVRTLRQTGYDVLVKQVPRQWHEANEEALRTSQPPMAAQEMIQIEKDFGSAVDQIWTSPIVQNALENGESTRAKDEIRRILKQRLRMTERSVMKQLTPAESSFRTRTAFAVTIGIVVVFVFVFRRVFRAFAAAQPRELNQPRGAWQFGRYRWAYLLLIPAVGSIALWTYYPLARGSVMAFQDYNVRGFSEWVGMKNFADALFSEEFWFAIWVSLKYVVMFTLFGFTAPIVLAFLLTEVPRGKILFRTIYYLPAVLSGIVVIFLWKGFYGPEGLINQMLNFFIGLLNALPGFDMAMLDKDWLKDPAFALLFVLLPVVWLSAGPGCLIYLAALKTVPDDLYEAADIDGAGIFQKVFHVAIPGIKGLILINFIGVIVAQMKGGSEFVLAMTQGGPHTPYGQTEVVGLHIYWQAFGRLRMGVATAMAWVLGSMLVGFTVMQMQRLSRMEFRAAAPVGK